MNIFIVHEEHSDLVLGAFSDKKVAEKFVSNNYNNSNYYLITDCLLDEYTGNKIRIYVSIIDIKSGNITTRYTMGEILDEESDYYEEDDGDCDELTSDPSRRKDFRLGMNVIEVKSTISQEDADEYAIEERKIYLEKKKK